MHNPNLTLSSPRTTKRVRWTGVVYREITIERDGGLIMIVERAFRVGGGEDLTAKVIIPLHHALRVASLIQEIVTEGG